MRAVLEVVNYQREGNKGQRPTVFVVRFILIASRNSISFGDKMLFIPSSEPPNGKQWRNFELVSALITLPSVFSFPVLTTVSPIMTDILVGCTGFMVLSIYSSYDRYVSETGLRRRFVFVTTSTKR